MQRSARRHCWFCGRAADSPCGIRGRRRPARLHLADARGRLDRHHRRRSQGSSRSSKVPSGTSCCPIRSWRCAVSARPNPSAVRATGSASACSGTTFSRSGPSASCECRGGKTSTGHCRASATCPGPVELGVFAEYWMVPWLRTRVEVRQGFNGHHGIVSDIFVDAVVPVGTQWTFSGGPRVTLASTAATSAAISA